MTFFSRAFSTAADLPLDDHLIGQCVVVNYRPRESETFTRSYVYEALFRTPRYGPAENRLLNNFVYCEAEFAVNVLDDLRHVRGIYYCQQNGLTSVCAHASIRMAVNTLRPEQRFIDNASVSAVVGQVNPDGLTPDEVKQVIEACSDLDVQVVGCDQLSSSNYLSILASTAESGGVALLVFSVELRRGEEPVISSSETGIDARSLHTVVSFGTTVNSDEWHPHAIRHYAGAESAKYAPSSSWVDHLVIHDDNFGPYFTLSSRALEVDPNVRATHIIIIRNEPCKILAHAVEAFASKVLVYLLPTISDQSDGIWFSKVVHNEAEFVMRPVLVSYDDYLEHLASAVGHNGARMNSENLSCLNGLPPLFWMVEFSVPDLFTGNKSKLGEILVGVEVVPQEGNPPAPPFLAARLPGLICIALSAEERPGALAVSKCDLDSHSPIYRKSPHDHEW